MNSQHPLFTQKHYEYLTERLRQVAQPEKRITAEVLCWILQQDNSKFKRAMFIEQIQNPMED